MPFKDYRLLQIMPAAPDWRAVFADENEEGLLIETQLAGWALVEKANGSQAVVGFDTVGEAESCESLENFLGYAAPGEAASRWHREAVRYFQERAATVGEAPEAEPLDVVRRLYRAIERNDWDAVASCYHPDADYSDPEVRLHGREAVAERAKALEAPFVEPSMRAVEDFAAAGKAAVTWTYRARNDRRIVMPGGAEMPATGRGVEVRGISVFHFADGLIVGEESEWDNASVYHQLGLLPDPALFGSW